MFTDVGQDVGIFQLAHLTRIFSELYHLDLARYGKARDVAADEHTSSVEDLQSLTLVERCTKFGLCRVSPLPAYSAAPRYQSKLLS